MSPEEKSKNIVNQMMANDRFSQWLGLKVISYNPGNVPVQIVVKEEMLNGFHIAHGGISYSLADSSLAFSSNSHGRHAVSVETSISHVQKVFVGDVLTTEVKEVSLNHKIGIYHIQIVNQQKVEVAHFKGTVYRSDKEWAFS